MEEQFSRTAMLLGEESVARLEKARAAAGEAEENFAEAERQYRLLDRQKEELARTEAAIPALEKAADQRRALEEACK